MSNNVNQKEKVFFIKFKENTKPLKNRILFEVLFAFILIFCINFGITMGEMDFTPNYISLFDVIYNVNFALAIWIGSFTFLAHLWMRRTTISSNFLNLVITYRNDYISKKEFWLSGIAQFVGGLLAAILVFLICVVGIDGNSSSQYVMGGTAPKIKSLFLSNPSLFDVNAITWNPINFEMDYGKSPAFGFAAAQGVVNAFAIMILFFLNSKIDKKSHNHTEAVILRYIILIVVILITTVMYSNTTNWVRLLSPAIIGQINSWIVPDKESIALWTTIVYILFQIPGLVFVYFSINMFGRKRKLKKGETNGI